MKKALLRSSLLTVLCVLGLVLGCGDDSASSSDAGGNGDSGVASHDSGADSGTDSSTPTGDSSVSQDDAGDDSGVIGDSGSGDAAISGSTLPSGSGYAVVYSAGAGIGIDGRPKCTVKFSKEGMTHYKASDDEDLDIGSCSLRSTGESAHAGWGTWIDGKATGKFYASDEKTFDDKTEVFHYAAGKLTFKSKLPKGKQKYTLVGGSAPTLTDVAEPGMIDSATISIDYGTDAVSAAMKLTVDGDEHSVKGDGMLYGDDKNAFAVNLGTTIMRGYIVGNEGQDLVISYVIEVADQIVIRGTAVLEK